MHDIHIPGVLLGRCDVSLGGRCFARAPWNFPTCLAHANFQCLLWLSLGIWFSASRERQAQMNGVFAAEIWSPAVTPRLL